MDDRDEDSDLDFAALDALEQQVVANQCRASVPTCYVEAPTGNHNGSVSVKGRNGRNFASEMPASCFSHNRSNSNSEGLWGHIFEEGDKLKSMYLKPSHCSITGKVNAMSNGLHMNKSYSGPLMTHKGCEDDKCVKEGSNCRNEPFSVKDFQASSFEDSRAIKTWKPTKQPVWRPKTCSLWEGNNHIGRGDTCPGQAMKTISNNNRQPDSAYGNSACMQQKNWETIGNSSCNAEKVPAMKDRDVCNLGSCKNNADMSRGASVESSRKPGLTSELEIKLTGESNHLAGNDIWYYKPRKTIPSSMEQDLAVCNTTSGGLKVCRNAARYWAYPDHVPERKYQIMATAKALLSNTLICFPTGLGKTLIAAVVMNNFVRWFPKGKAVFIAPTKPLVSQQMIACQCFMGLHDSCIAEMTGRARGDDRKDMWTNEHIHVYFCTPQTFWNDVRRGICPYELISCIVVDECHRATGQADIAQAIKYMRNEKKLKFRVLGLSATPGSSTEQVQQIITTLGISTVVFRDENDHDVMPYVHKKDSETHIVGQISSQNTSRAPLLGSLQQLVGSLSAGQHYYGAADAERVSRFGLLQAKKVYKGNDKSVLQQFYQAALLADVRDQLDGYGPKAALSFLQEKFREQRCLQALRERDPQFSYFVQSLERSVAAGAANPKIQKLKEILAKYFDDSSEKKVERAIVFATLRDGVSTILDSLESMRPIVIAKGFVGQSSGSKKGGTGMKQKEQKQVLRDFSSGTCNVLVATCIGEEGLDIPNVDLIICFDAISSPTRALQRQGRTGRHGDGKVIYLVSAGKEEEQFKRAAESMGKLHQQLKEADRFFSLCKSVVRMLPREFEPTIAHIRLETRIKSDVDCERQNDQSAERVVSAVPGIENNVLQQDIFLSESRQVLTNEESLCKRKMPTPLKTNHPDSNTRPIEDVTLSLRRQALRQQRSCSQADAQEHLSPAISTFSGSDSILIDQEGIKEKRNFFVVDSQSPVKKEPNVSLEHLSILDAEQISPNLVPPQTRQKFNRLCRYREMQEAPTSINNRPRKISRGPDTFSNGRNDNRERKLHVNTFLDTEAQLSGDDDSSFGTNPSSEERYMEELQDFIDDATPAVEGPDPTPQWVNDGNSPSPLQVMRMIRAKRGVNPSPGAAGNETNFASPDEYDLEDSFINDSNIEYLSGPTLGSF